MELLNINLMTIILSSLGQTLTMVSVSAVIGICLGVPLGAFMFVASPRGLGSLQICYKPFSFIINMLRSIPFIILTVLLIPLTRLFVGTSIGTEAAIIPLSVCAILLIARSTEEGLCDVPKSFHDLGFSLGMSHSQIVRHILMWEALPGLVGSYTTIIINLIGFSAMAGTMGGGGLGDLAIRYGYQRYDTTLMIIIVLILVVIVQLTQAFGKYLSEKIRHT